MYYWYESNLFIFLWCEGDTDEVDDGEAYILLFYFEHTTLDHTTPPHANII